MRQLALLCVAAVACKSETSFEQREARLSVNPPLLDLGDVAVGTSVEGLLEVDHIDGLDATIRNVSVVNLVGDAFSYQGPDAVTVPRGTRVDVPIVFSPVVEGWFTAKVTVTHDGLDSPAEVDVRGHGVLGEATLSPLALDFGAVDVGATGGRDVTLSNEGTVDLQVSDLSLSHPTFSVGLTAPVTVSAGADLTIPVRFEPTDDLAVTGTLTVTIGGVDLPQVALRGNDCEGGLPEAYDTDDDGFTTCGGDCDDDDGQVHPGGLEVADGVDQDCDGLVDEQTDAYDDDGDGASEQQGDCNDGSPDVGPAVTEVPDNGVDDDCDGVVDTAATDLDGDGYDPTAGGDCDDLNATIHPGAPELPDGEDNDCDGAVDEGTAVHDDDGDGYCEAATCLDGSMGDDCNDADAGTNPGANEIPDGQDTDCDGVVDEATTSFDDDGDGYTEVGGDCDDNDPLANPGLGTCP